MNMSIKKTAIPLVEKSFSTNGVLRCISGKLPSGNTEKDIADSADILDIVQKVFNYSDKDLVTLLQSKNPFGVFLCTIGAGKKLLVNNPNLGKLLDRLKVAESKNRIDNELSNIISEVGEHINLKI